MNKLYKDILLNQIKGAGSPPPSIPTPASRWKFNEGSGGPGATLVDQQGAFDLTYGAATPSWNADSLIMGATSTDVFSAGSNAYNTVTSYTINVWVTPALINTTLRDIIAIGSGDGSQNYGMHIGYDNGASLYTEFSVRNAVPATTTLSVAQVITTTDKWMIMARYTRVGGAADNIMQLDFTKDGITWYTGSRSDGALQQAFASGEFRDRRNSAVTSGRTMYDAAIWTSVLTNTDRDALFAAGSEGVW